MRSDGKEKIPASGFNRQCNFSHVHIYIALESFISNEGPYAGAWSTYSSQVTQLSKHLVITVYVCVPLTYNVFTFPIAYTRSICELEFILGDKFKRVS